MNPQDPIKSKRVPRFVEEYAKDRNGTQAVIRAGYSPNGADVTACRLLADPRIAALVDAQIEKVSKEALYEAVDVLRDWVDIATADASRLMHVRRLNCRHCWGLGHEHQWSAREYAQACDAAATRVDIKGLPAPAPPPSCAGGFGWVFNAEPNPQCPECQGEGVEDVFFADVGSLSGPERKLFAGVKRTKDGLEIKTHDQDAARLHIAKHLGMLVEKRELTGKDGKPLLPAPLPVELPSDPKLLAALYAQVTGG